MSDAAITINDIGKMYRIGLAQERARSFGEACLKLLKAPFERFRQLGEKTRREEEFWALQGISFDVHPGEVVGIIGRNGAGKSTLLKILSRITEPTTGRAVIHGRVGSLLEVGTGFHRDLTGRENVYLNGAILGMKKVEIDEKFDDIVDFSGVAKFIDTPVKRYSSGMFVRLAFAVAAHLEPEIMIVDEVLAVGDAAFQKRCLGKMEDVSKTGRTVLFVSHNMGAVETLCTRGVYLEDGQVAFDGPVHEAVSQYLSKNYVNDDDVLTTCARSGTGRIRLTGFHLETPDGRPVANVKSGDDVVFCLDYRTHGDHITHVSPSISIHAENEDGLFLNYSHFSDTYFEGLPDRGTFRCLVRKLPLTVGNYLVGLRVLEKGAEADWPRIYIPFNVAMGDFYGTSTVEGELNNWGHFLVDAEWSAD